MRLKLQYHPLNCTFFLKTFACSMFFLKFYFHVRKYREISKSFLMKSLLPEKVCSKTKPSFALLCKLLQNSPCQHTERFSLLCLRAY